MILGIKKSIEIKWNSVFSIKIIRLFFLKFWEGHLRQNSENIFTSKKAISWIKTFWTSERSLTLKMAKPLETYNIYRENCEMYEKTCHYFLSVFPPEKKSFK